MANLLSIGASGLNAAQLALTTTSNNIANAGTDGYSRQSTVQAESISESNGSYTIGTGVTVTSVQRAYSQYLTQAVWSSNSSLQRATSYDDLTSALNSAFSDVDLATSLDDFYSAFSTLSDDAASSSSRQALLSSASTLATNFNTLSQQLEQQRSDVNSEVASTVGEINSTAASIAKLNQQIAQANASGTDAPNDLLDERDELVNTLSGYVGVSVVSESNGSISVYTSGGQTLVSGNQSYALSTGGNAYDATTTDVYDSAGNDLTSQLSGGTLGALLDYRSDVLDSAEDQLGQIATALAASVNAQQAEGLDADGEQGADMFSVDGPTVTGSSHNAGSATVGASVDDASALTGDDYILSYDGSAWSLKTTSGQSVAMTDNGDGTYSAAGLTIAVSGDAQAGDSYQILPTRAAAGSLAVSMTDADKIAAAAALTATAASANTGSAAVSSIAVSDAGDSALLDGATVSFTSATAYQVTDGDGNVLASGDYSPGQAISADGWSLTLTGTPAAGDSFTVAANSNGLNDTSNAQAMAALADAGVLDDGGTSVTDAYASLTSWVGSVGSEADTDLTTQTSLHDTAVSNQQSLSGVNLDEEATNLVQYQQAYQASAQIISTAQTIFESLLTAVQSS